MAEFIRAIIPDPIKELFKDLSGHNFIRNYYRSSFNKAVLLSYINKPFISKQKHSHTNLQEAVAIAEVFHNLGYRVDLINYTKAKAYPVDSYDVVFGLGEAVEFALLSRKGKGKPFVIWHGTGASPFYSNPISINRLNSSYQESGILFFASTRFIERSYPLSYVFSDLIVLYGNEFTKGTYKPHSVAPIELITPTTYFTHSPKSKNKLSQKHYVWFGSKGAIHKGLDLLLNFFFNHPELNLHICSDLSQEIRFYEFYKKKISECRNIHYHGFVELNSNHFKELMDTATFSIMPSCSEGIATSVLATMANGGMIPIVTKNTGIDIRDYGILIDEISLEGIERAIDASQRLTLEEINSRSMTIIDFTRENYSIHKFSEALKEILEQYLNKYQAK